jgi:hypothetical protein
MADVTGEGLGQIAAGGRDDAVEHLLAELHALDLDRLLRVVIDGRRRGSGSGRRRGRAAGLSSEHRGPQTLRAESDGSGAPAAPPELAQREKAALPTAEARDRATFGALMRDAAAGMAAGDAATASTAAA